MTPAELTTCIPFAASRSTLYAPLLTAAMAEFGIDTRKRQAAFLAQVCHESGSLKYTRELADGSVYENRRDLGNVHPGDGPRFRGRGLLQITGRANYMQCGAALNLDLVAAPELLEEPIHAARSSAWFWHSHELNEHADADRFWSISRIINGGTNGLDDRIIHWIRIRKALAL